MLSPCELASEPAGELLSVPQALEEACLQHSRSGPCLQHAAGALSNAACTRLSPYNRNTTAYLGVSHFHNPQRKGARQQAHTPAVGAALDLSRGSRPPPHPCLPCAARTSMQPLAALGCSYMCQGGQVDMLSTMIHDT